MSARPVFKRYQDLEDTFCPIRFGAAADGLTDDRLAVQNAMAAAGAGGVVDGLGKTYAIGTSELISVAGVRLVNMTLKKIANISIIRVNAAGFTIRDVVLDGNQAAGFTNQCINNSAGGDDLTIRDCIVKNANLNGIASANCARLTVRDTKFSGNQQRDIVINPTSGTSRDCKVIGCVLDGTGITGAFSRLTGTPGAGGTADFNGLQVIGNTIIGANNSSAFCLDLSQGSGVQSQGWLVEGNTARLSGNALGGYSFGIGSGICSGNTFDVNGFNATGGGIEIGTVPAGGTTNGTQVIGNTILGGTTLTVGIIADGAATSTGHVIANNVVNGLLPTATAAIRVIANVATCFFSDMVISANNVTWGGAGTGISGILINTNNASATANRILIIGNNVRGNGAASSAGIKLNNNALGTIDRCTIIGNCNTNVVTPISQTGDTNTLVPAGTNQS